MPETPKTILLKGKSHVIHKEGVAAAGITPGHLLERNTSGQFVVHNSAGVNAQKLFALENDIFGKQITDAYVANDQVIAAYCQGGVEVYALVAASAAAIVIGDYLESAGDGTLRKAATDTATDDTQRAAPVAVAIEAVDNSAGGSPARIRVEVL